jgi:hypothetical protein
MINMCLVMSGCTLLTIDWLYSLIGPGVLLLVVSYQFAIPILVLWAELKKSKW